MSRSLLKLAVCFSGATLLLSILLTPPADASRLPRPGTPVAALRLVAPEQDARVAEPTGLLQAEPAGLADPHIVLSRERFDPSGWTDLPAGPAWTVIPYEASNPPALASLGLRGRAEAPYWWALVGRDPASGRLSASEVRRFVLVPRFANRVSPSTRLSPSASGSLSAPSADELAAYRPIALASGHVVMPNGQAAAKAPSSTAAGTGGRRGMLVQFAEGSADAARARIERAGATIVSTMGGSAFLVRADEGARERLAVESGMPWIGEWQPPYKVCTLLDRAASGPLDVTALLFPDADDDGCAAALAGLGAGDVRSHRGPLNHLVRFTLDPARIDAAAALADVQWMEPTARDSFSNDQAQWVLQTNVPGERRIWDMGLRGQGQVVMTSDSGVRTTHEMFFDSLTALATWGHYPTHRKIIAYLPGSSSTDIQFGDDVYSSYHGTHTGGTVAGNADASSGAPWSGMAKDAKLFFMDMSGPSIGGSLATPDDLNELFEPSYIGNAAGAARISSNSWGNYSSFGRYLLQSMQVDQFTWSHPDYLIAFAAGNIGLLGAVQAPGTAKNCLTVGATGNGEFANQIASFSSGGPTEDLRWKPTLCAPGAPVVSSIGNSRYTYAAYEGTSMSTPAVAGTMALIRQYLTEGWYPTGAPVAANAFTPSAALLKAMAVCASRNDVLPSTSPNNRSGWGRLTADDVLYFPGDSSRTLLIDATDGLPDQRYVEYQTHVTDASRPLKIVLCWTDAPGHPGSAVQLVNDLDLAVIQGANTYLGNRLLNFNSATGGVRDSLNVEEVVHFFAPAPGLYTIRVSGRRVPQGPQPFALCITGGVGGSAGAVALDRFEYGLTDTLGIEVLDANAVPPVSVTLVSTTEDFGETVQLTGDNGVFRGTFPIGPAVPQLHDGVLAVSSGDQVTVRYADGSPAVTVSTNAQVNAQQPVITVVHASALSPSSALVTWTTDVPSTSRVRFGTGTPSATRDSAGLTSQHAVLLTGLAAGRTYRYDVESVTRIGCVAADSLGGLHRSFTTGSRGDVALVMDDPSASTLATWQNALAALGLTADVLTKAECDPPLLGDSSSGLRSYAAVLWQVDPDRYPPFSDAQRAAIDALMEGGTRLLVTGHDLGWGMADMGSPSYSEERELWVESGLKTRYFYDISWVYTFMGVPGDPVSGDFTGGVPYHAEIYPDAGDVVMPAPGTDGTGVATWLNDNTPVGQMGIRWESHAPKGAPGLGVWGGHTSRLVSMFYEWRALESTGTANAPMRTTVLARAVDWLLERRPPTVIITAPAPGTTVTADYLTIRYVTAPDAGRTIVNRALDYSLDGGESWAPITTTSFADSGYIWDLGGSLGGQPVPNSTRVLVRVSAADDGVPAIRSVSTMTGPFTLARPTGDVLGPALVGGSARTSPSPLQRGSTGQLLASFSDAETGGGSVAAAEYSLGTSPAPAGAGTAMDGAFGSPTVAASAALNTSAVDPGSQYIWLRARDGAGNWGPASALAVIANDRGVLGVADLACVDFLAPASPNPATGPVTLRFGLQRTADVRVEIFDVAGRRVRTLVAGALPAGQHSATWDGRDERSSPVRAGVFFVRLMTPERSFKSRLVRLD